MKIDLVKNLNNIKATIPNRVQLVAVSKTKPADNIKTLYDAGQRVFGENRVEELVEKNEILPKDIKWHMIGHLQSKKVKKIAPFISLIHSVDSFKLLKEINKQAKRNNRTIDCLIQFHIAQEESKYGFTLDSALEMIEIDEFENLQNINILGVMGMATFTKNEEIVRNEFKTLKKISKKIQEKLPKSTEISMGMSGDYLIAIEEGSTIIRVGSTIFGARN